MLARTTLRQVASLFLIGLASVNCVSEESVAPEHSESSESAVGKAVPTVTVTPSPVQQGSIGITKPVAHLAGFAPGRDYNIRVSGGYDAGALDSLSAWITTDKTGAFDWPFQGDSLYGRPDTLLNGPASTVIVTEYKRSGSSVDLASATVTVTANPGSATISPNPAAPGTTLAIAGTGAQPGASLEASWYDQTNCTCWMFGCHSCTWVPRTVSLTADGSGNFSSSVTPAAVTGAYCKHPLSIVQPSNGAIIATVEINFCP